MSNDNRNEREALARIIAVAAWSGTSLTQGVVEYRIADAILAAGYQTTPNNDVLADVWDEGAAVGYIRGGSRTMSAIREANPYRPSVTGNQENTP